jgi:hypothetical protein
MKRKVTLIEHIAIIGMIMVIGASCSEPVKVEPYTYSKLFTGETQKSWTIRSIQLVAAGKATQTLGASACMMDDLYVFYNNPERSIQILEGSKKCVAGSDDLVTESNWAFVNATATLSMPMRLFGTGDFALPFILKEVDDTKLVADIYLQDGSAYRFNFKSADNE